MKTLVIGFIGIWGLALLASDAAAQKSPTYPNAPFPKVPAASQGFCNANNAVLVIMIQNTGNVVAFACDQARGRAIENKPSLPPDVPILDVQGDLGVISKYKSATDPDPCIEWNVGGVPKFYCW